MKFEITLTAEQLEKLPELAAKRDDTPALTLDDLHTALEAARTRLRQHEAELKAYRANAAGKAPYEFKFNLLGQASTKGLKEVTEWSFEYGTTYAIIGQFHARDWGALRCCLRHAVTATYGGTYPGDPYRHVFHDTQDGMSYVVTSPELTLGMHSARVYRIPKARQKKLPKAA